MSALTSDPRLLAANRATQTAEAHARAVEAERLAWRAAGIELTELPRITDGGAEG